LYYAELEINTSLLNNSLWGFNLENNIYIEMKEFKNHWYFYDEDIKVPNEDVMRIKPLSKGYSSLQWNKYISDSHRHFKLLNNNDYLSQIDKKDYNWLDDWNNGTYENFKNYLVNNLPYNREDTILIFWSEETAIETNWDIFLKH
jgi:hypothetical protein